MERPITDLWREQVAEYNFPVKYLKGYSLALDLLVGEFYFFLENAVLMLYNLCFPIANIFLQPHFTSPNFLLRLTNTHILIR